MIELPYLFETQLIFAVLWLFYCLFLRNLGNFGKNRLYLLAVVFVSFLLPLLSFPVFTRVVETEVVTTLESIRHTVPPVEYPVLAGEVGRGTADVRWLFVLGWAVGSSFLILRFVRQIGRLRISDGRKDSFRLEDGTPVVFSASVHAPFSFLNRIYIPLGYTGREGLEHILAHERTHIEKKHTLDAFLGQLLIVLFWWNPFVWLWNRSIREIHEFQADDHVLEKGDAAGYIRLLVEEITGHTPSFVQNFNDSLIKKRIRMIVGREQVKRGTGRFLLALPLLTLLLLLFSFNEQVVTRVIEINPEFELLAPFTGQPPLEENEGIPNFADGTPDPGKEPEETPLLTRSTVTERKAAEPARETTPDTSAVRDDRITSYFKERNDLPVADSVRKFFFFKTIEVIRDSGTNHYSEEDFDAVVYNSKISKRPVGLSYEQMEELNVIRSLSINSPRQRFLVRIK